MQRINTCTCALKLEIMLNFVDIHIQELKYAFLICSVDSITPPPRLPTENFFHFSSLFTSYQLVFLLSYKLVQ